MRLRKQESDNWDRSLAGAMFAINKKKSRGHKYSNLELLCGMKARGPVEVTLANELNKGWLADEEGGFLMMILKPESPGWWIPDRSMRNGSCNVP